MKSLIVFSVLLAGCSRFQDSDQRTMDIEVKLESPECTATWKGHSVDTQEGDDKSVSGPKVM